MIIDNKRKRFTNSRFILIVLILLISLITVTKGFTFSKLQSSHMTVALRPIIRNIENRIVDYKTHQYQFITTENFVIRYDEDIPQEVLELVVTTAKDKYKVVSEIFQYYPKEKILLVLYDDAEAMMKTTMLKNASLPMGVYYGNTIHILNPLHWIEGENIDTVFYSEGPLLHELVHLFTDHIGKGNFPLWFTEGVSLYFEYMIDDYEWGKEVVFQEEYTLEELTNHFHELDEFLAYTQSFRIIKAFVDEYGLETLIEIIRTLGTGVDFEEFIGLF